MNNVYVSPFSFALLVRLNWQVYWRGSFHLQRFCSTLNSLFVILLHCQKRKSIISQVYWIVKFLSQCCFPLFSKNIWFGNYFIYSLKRYVLTYQIIHTTESTIKHCWLNRFVSFSFLLMIYSITIVLRSTRADATTTMRGENWQ